VCMCFGLAVQRAMCASVGRYLMISLGMPYGHGDLPVPRCWMVWSNVSLFVTSKSVREGSPRSKGELVGGGVALP
jgi:hypothetical protein